MSSFYNQLGGIYWWLFIKFGTTKLADEQDEKNQVRNLLFVTFLNLLIVILVIIYLNN